MKFLSSLGLLGLALAADETANLRGNGAGEQKDDAPTPSYYPQYRGVNVGGWLVLESWMYPDW